MTNAKGSIDFTGIGFGINSLLIENGEVDLYGSGGVGNVVWDYGDSVIDYASAPLPDLGGPSVPERAAASLMLAGLVGLLPLRGRRARSRHR